MRRYQDIGSTIAQLLLLTALAQGPGEGDRATVWDAAEPARRCFAVDVPQARLHWLTLRTDRPSTAPAAMMLGPAGADPRMVGRLEAILLDVDVPGEHIVCLTSSTALGNARLVLQRAGDPLEIEEEIDPLTDSGGLSRAGDPLEIEEEIDP